VGYIDESLEILNNDSNVKAIGYSVKVQRRPSEVAHVGGCFGIWPTTMDAVTLDSFPMMEQRTEIQIHEWLYKVLGINTTGDAVAYLHSWCNYGGNSDTVPIFKTVKQNWTTGKFLFKIGEQ